MKMKKLADSWFLLIFDGLCSSDLLMPFKFLECVLRCSGLFVILLEIFECMYPGIGLHGATVSLISREREGEKIKSTTDREKGI